MLREKNRKWHSDLRRYIEVVREYHLFDDLPPNIRISAVALSLMRFRINYGMGEEDQYGGSYLDISSDAGEPVTFKWGNGKEYDTHPEKNKKWSDNPPGLECGGFVEAVVYCAGITDRRIIDYHNRRRIPENTKLFRESRGNQNWVPRYDNGKQVETTATQDAGLTGAWAQTPHLIFFDPLFFPRPNGVYPNIGDIVFFQSKDSKSYHVHVGIWTNLNGEDGLVHSSPGWKYDNKSGPKFTSVNSPYYRWLDPQRHQWAEWFGASVTRLKEAV